MRKPVRQEWLNKLDHILPSRGSNGEYISKAERSDPIIYKNSTARKMNKTSKRHDKYLANKNAKLFREINSFESENNLRKLYHKEKIISEEARKLRYYNFRRIKNDDQKQKYLKRIGNLNAIDVLAKFASQTIKEAIAEPQTAQ